MADRNQIAQWLNLHDWSGVPTDIRAVSSIEDATPTTAVFAATGPNLADALTSAAGLILVKPGLEETTDHRVLLVPDPRLAFSILAAHLHPAAEAAIHPTAVVHPTAALHATVSVGAGAVIGAAASIGASTTIGPRAVVEPGVIIGERVRIQAGAVLGSLGFGYARKPDGTYLLFPQQGTLVIEDDVEIGANTTIDRGALGETRIGAGTKIDNLVHIGHNCRIGRNVILAAQTGISGSTVVEDGAILGGQVGIGEHALVGPGVILGGGAGVLSNKKLHGPGQVFWGRPAQPLRQYLRDLARLRKGSA